MAEIQKAAHYRSFYEVAKKITSTKARLAFYEALDAYRFEGAEPENLPVQADIAFTAIKPILDADIDRKAGGAPAGNSNAKKNNMETTSKQLKNNMETTSKQLKNNMETTSKQLKNNPETTKNNPPQEVVLKKTNNDNDNDNEKEDDDGNTPPPPPSAFPQNVYAENLKPLAELSFDLLKGANLPCQNGDYDAFVKKDFMPAVDTLRYFEVIDVVESLENYIRELKDDTSYVKKQYTFEEFIKSKTFKNCLKVNYRHENFIKFGTEKMQDRNKKEVTPEQKEFKNIINAHPAECVYCKKTLVDSSNGLKTSWFCRNCEKEWTLKNKKWQEVA